MAHHFPGFWNKKEQPGQEEDMSACPLVFAPGSLQIWAMATFLSFMRTGELGANHMLPLAALPRSDKGVRTPSPLSHVGLRPRLLYNAVLC